MAHIAGLRMNLSHESWSETAADEVKLESELNAEEAARLKAVKARKAAEKARRDAQREADDKNMEADTLQVMHDQLLEQFPDSQQ